MEGGGGGGPVRGLGVEVDVARLNGRSDSMGSVCVSRGAGGEGGKANMCEFGVWCAPTCWKGRVSLLG